MKPPIDSPHGPTQSSKTRPSPLPPVVAAASAVCLVGGSVLLILGLLGLIFLFSLRTSFAPTAISLVTAVHLPFAYSASISFAAAHLTLALAFALLGVGVLLRGARKPSP